ncbi:MAG: MMPL family transporter [Treponema sp.]|jgi:predicted RND superfamily exporter protein|nr:MMPL family transporter [Treponema sp.]
MEKLFKKPALIAGIIIAITVFLGFQLPRVRLDNNNIRFLPDRNKAKIISDYIDNTFGGQLIILVGLERPYRTIFDKNFLAKIREYSQSVEAVPFVKSVNSIMSTQYITGDAQSVIVSDLVPENFGGTHEEIDELKRRIASWDLFRDSLVSADLSSTQILITLDVMTADSGRPEVAKTIRKIREIAAEIFTGEAEIYFTGQPIMNATINESIIADNLLLIPLVVIVVLGMLYFSFRRSARRMRMVFVALPLLTVLIAVVWTIGLASLAGLRLSIITTILPVILVAVGHAYGVHIVTHYAKDTGGRILSIEEHRQIVFELMRKMIKPVSLAAVTTITGFISFCFTPIIPMREFGVCASAGVVSVYIMAILFIPSVLLLRYSRIYPSLSAEEHSENAHNDRFTNIVADIFLSIAQKKILVLVMALIIIIVSLYGISRISVDNSVVEFFRNETDISRSDRFIREQFAGSKELNLVIRCGTTEELLHPDVLCAIDRLSAYLTDWVPDVGKTAGFTDIIKRINQVFNVDQNPEGLRSAVSDNTDSIVFGDTGDFGFGGFGFAETASYARAADPAADPAEITEPENRFSLNQYKTSDILEILDSAGGISGKSSGSDIVRELKRHTNYDGMAYYEIPEYPARYAKKTPEDLQRLIANYLVLLAGDEDSGYSNDPLEPTAIRMLIQLRATGNNDIQAVIDEINNFIDANFPENTSVLIGGSATQEMAVTGLIINSQIISIFISVLTIFLIMAFAHKSIIAGIIGAFPLILAVLCNFIIMGFFGIKLNLGTVLIASLTVCIGIDDAIHFIEFFKREYREGEENSLRRTFNACGRAICVTAISVGAGFGVLALSRFKIISEFGMIVAFSMVLTTLVSLTVIPALLMLIRPKFVYGSKRSIT